MARYKPRDPHAALLLPVSLAAQIQPGTFEYAIHWMVDHEIDLSVFDTRYRNDDTGASAYHPGILLKVVLLGYSRGLTSSRAIAQACEENVLFMALAGDVRPHFTTTAAFIWSDACCMPYIHLSVTRTSGAARARSRTQSTVGFSV